MTKRQSLSEYFSLHRRYYRSVNLERDISKPDAIQGYVLTERASEALSRITSAFGNPDAHRAWTITGVYGTGKSAFAHYLTVLSAPDGSTVRQGAVQILEKAFGADSPEWQTVQDNLPKRGLVRAVATGQREPLSWTIARALIKGTDLYWQRKRKPKFCQKLTDWEVELDTGTAEISNQQVLAAIQEIANTAKTPIFFVVDELGKNLEFAAHNQGVDDLYLLQQIAELQLSGEHQVYFLGLLHQSFAGYSERLAAVEQSEWIKIQGRFEDISFTESPSQMTRLIGQAIDHSQAESVRKQLQKSAKAWDTKLKTVLTERDVTESVLLDAYPVHPITALVLPLLCVRYAQNDRSLFTFLTSDEPYAFPTFLASAQTQDKVIPTLQLHQLYDYFVESVTGLASRINLQRWVEIQELIEDAQDQSPDVLKVLKTIGILNLITTTGQLRATPQLVTLALCDMPRKADISRWRTIVLELQQRGVITHRKQLDELRIWEGSDFNVEAAIYSRLEQTRIPLAELLTNVYPAKPLVAQRHYVETGTLRYFEQHYADSLSKPKTFQCSNDSYDGLIVYWLDPGSPKEVPLETANGKPVIWVHVANVDLIRTRAKEFQILKDIQKEAPELRTDGVARKEVKYRLAEAERLLDETITQSFDWVDSKNQCWVNGDTIALQNTRAFQALLSDTCDRVYHQHLKLDNELINRRELTSQGSKARRELIEAMIEHEDQPRLGLEGYGPEVAMYYSVLEATGIHRQENGEWSFNPPYLESGVTKIWQAIEKLCLGAKKKQKTLDLLYQELGQPPYGLKQGVLPVLLAAVLLYHIDDIGIYKEGTFIPLLGAEHFELLIKDPSRFAVKHIEIKGLRSQVFRELEAILKGSPAKQYSGGRNLTVLSVVKPLVHFVRKLPKYTTQTKRISKESQAVVHVLLTTQEPDELLFTLLPQACELLPIKVNESDENPAAARKFREKLVECLREIYTAYDKLLNDCQALLYNAFGLRSNHKELRKDLQFRAQYLLGNCSEVSLNRFVRAAVDEEPDDRSWLETLLMIVIDKPSKSWNDRDYDRFEFNLSDLARRFRNLEALQKEISASNRGGFEARRITVTRPDGSEINRVVWMDHEQQTQVLSLGSRILDECQDPQLRQSLFTWLADQMFSENTSYKQKISKSRKLKTEK